MKIALVGPGLMPIPPQGWGAVESLIWKYATALRSEGHDVIIYNSRNLHEVTDEINTSDVDFVHVHYDEFARHFSLFCKKQFCITSHYGYILKRNRWAKGYLSIFADFLGTQGIIALSPQIRDLYIDAGYKGNAYVLKNPIDASSFAFTEKGNNKVICLGKIEPRKQQAILATILDGKVDVDFIGPIVDSSFKGGKTTQYKGVWTSEEVSKHLTEYSTLLLLSDGEAAPLVVIEALAAGLSVVISKSAAANLETKPFITILEDNDLNSEHLASILIRSVNASNTYRKDSRAYGSTFDMSNCIKEYENIITNFLQSSNEKVEIKRAKRNYIAEHFFGYYTSRVWLGLSGVPLLRKLKKAL